LCEAQFRRRSRATLRFGVSLRRTSRFRFAGRMLDGRLEKPPCGIWRERLSKEKYLRHHVVFVSLFLEL
jgi:hypothetical protein